ncbi:MAG: mercury resistance system transport protein MerF [Paracoccaceae bacterium]
MQNSRLLKIGAVGTVIAALCCFTPVLVVLLGVVGLSAMVGMLDVILFPALAVFIGITIYALVKRAQT